MAANPSIQLGTDGNWAIKEDNLLAYKKDGTRFFNKEFDFTRGTFATFVDKDGLIKVSGVTDTELITNGDFATDSNWSKGTGWSIANGKASCNGSFSSLIQFGVYSNPYNKSFVATINVSNYTSGYFSVGIGGYNFFGRVESNGEHKIYFNVTNSQSNDRFYINGQGFNGSIDNISVKEIQTDVPRIDFTDDATGHLLLEPQSTNLIPYSEDFSQWTLGPNSTLTFESNVIAPDGSLGVYRLQNPQTGSTFLSIGFRNCRNFSLFVKAVTEGVNNQFNLDASGQPTDTRTATTQWQRFNRDFGTQANYNLSINNGIDNYASDIYIWGAQAEALSYATSYIPTYGSTATRNADVCNNSGSAQDFSEEGVIYAEIAALANDGTFREISLNDGTINNAVEIRYINTDDLLQFVVRDNGSATVVSSINISNVLEFNKVAFSYKNDDCKMYIDGIEVATDTNCTMPSGLNRLSFNWGGANAFYGKTKNLKVFKRAMSDGELYLLTVTQYQSYQEMATALNYTL